MKNIFKAFIIMILTFALSIPMQITVKASTYVDMGLKKDVVVNKPWTVSFNKPLSVATVNTTNIKVVSENNKQIDVKVTLANNNKSIIVKSVENYEFNKTYTLIVTEKVNSADGKPLPKEVRMNFNTKSETLSPNDFTICIDPGQYYKVLNGINGSKAKDINLSTALKLGSLLKTRGFNVVYTRDSDSVNWTESNEDDAKATIAKNANADIFLSVNTNSYDLTTANGIETYFISDAKGNNKKLAGLVQDELVKATGATNRGIKDAGNGANSEVLKKTSLPSVSLNLGFITNPIEEVLLSSEKYQSNAAKAIANGLMEYTSFENTDTTYDTNYNSLFQISSVKDLVVNLEVGNTYTFPKTVQATLTNNETRDMGVEWLQNSINLTTPGTYSYEGVIENYDKKVKVTIKVSTKIYKIVLDPGHGGSDPGAVGAMGTQEKVVVLAITSKVGDILAKNGVQVTYTRTVDKTQSLQAKCDVSNIAKPDYFVSIHANSYSVPTVSGIETFYSSGNAAGAKLAQAIQTELIKETGRVDRKIKTAGFYVLNNTNATAVLVETSFLSNAAEEKLLVTESYQNKLAKAISTGILKSLGITDIVY
jgi:N-acetylmuramoyl-L-alanine amidase